MNEMTGWIESDIPEKTIEQIALIRKIIKRKCRTLSVRCGTGTAWGWVDIGGSGEFHNFTEPEKKALEELGLNYGGNCANISPEDRKFWLRKWLGIPEPKKEEKQTVFIRPREQQAKPPIILENLAEKVANKMIEALTKVDERKLSYIR